MKQNETFYLIYKDRITYVFEYQKKNFEWRVHINDSYEDSYTYDDYSIDEAEDMVARIVCDLDAKLVSKYKIIPINIRDILKAIVNYY